ncbi:alpha/beta fold hydrolase [Spirosoma gilvum]
MQAPITKYVDSKGVHIAYQVAGNGPVDLLLILGWVSNIEEAWQVPEMAAWLHQLSSFCRLILFDKRGTGLSDRVNDQQLPGLSERIEDLNAILKACHCTTVNIIGISEGVPMAILFAATYPERVEKLVLFGGYARWIADSTYPWGLTRQQHARMMEVFEKYWGEPLGIQQMAPSLAKNPDAQLMWARYLRRSASPGTAVNLYRMNIEIDVRQELAQVKTPTLVMNRKGDKLISADHSAYLFNHIPDARHIELEGDDHLPFHGDTQPVLMAIESFLAGNQVVSVASKSKGNHTALIFRIKNYIDLHYSQPITLAFLTKQFGINEYDLKTEFKRLVGQPVIAYLKDVRFQIACQMLKETRESIDSIAEQVGYQHTNNFSASFKKEFGLSPLAWRNK